MTPTTCSVCGGDLSPAEATAYGGSRCEDCWAGKAPAGAMPGTGNAGTTGLTVDMRQRLGTFRLMLTRKQMGRKDAP